MATQNDDIDVGHLVRIGLIGTFLIIAISYAVTGLDFFHSSDLSTARIAEAQVVKHLEAPSVEQLADIEAARAAILKRYAR